MRCKHFAYQSFLDIKQPSNIKTCGGTPISLGNEKKETSSYGTILIGGMSRFDKMCGLFFFRKPVYIIVFPYKHELVSKPAHS